MRVTVRSAISLAVATAIGVALVGWTATHVPRPRARSASRSTSAPVTTATAGSSADRNLANLARIAATIELYRDDRRDAYPDSLDALFKFADFLSADDVRQMTTHPVTGRCPGYTYVKPAATMTDPRTTPMLYEFNGTAPDRDGVIVYADGHVEAARGRR